MTLQAAVLADGPGWRVHDVTCTAGPHDRAFEERHGSFCIAVVCAGTFQYRTATGSALLAPGAVMLGNHAQCFECGHEHGVGDRCISFRFDADYWQDVVAAVPGARRTGFSVPRLPPLTALAPLQASAEAACDGADAVEVEELALRIAAAVIEQLEDRGAVPAPVSARDVRRVTDVVRHIERQAQGALSLRDLSRLAAMSPYHFLRVFDRVVGTTPHQFLLHLRLQRAAANLRTSDRSIADIALEAGFNDLSTFNRRFRRLMGTNPRTCRA